MGITIEQAIAEIENSGMYGNQVHQETLEWALIALKEKLDKNRREALKKEDAQ